MSTSLGAAVANHLLPDDIFLVNGITTNGAVPQVAAFANGGFVITWSSLNQQNENDNGVYAQRFDADGNPVGGELHVNELTFGDQEFSRITTFSTGKFLVTWDSNNQDGSGYGTYGRLYNADGTPVGGEFRINQTTDNNQLGTNITALANGHFVVSWSSEDQNGKCDVLARCFDADGNALGNEFLVNKVTQANDQFTSKVAALQDGTFIVTWDSYSNGQADVFARIYDENGVPQGAEFLVNSTLQGDQLNSSMTVLSDGSFIFTWASEVQNNNGYDIYGRHFGANGQPLGDEFLINQTTDQYQYDANVVSVGDGGFLVSWTSTVDNGNGESVFARRYDKDANAIGPEFEVGSGYTNNSSIAVLSDGSLLITWRSLDDQKIHARVFESLTPVQGTDGNDGGLSGSDGSDLIDGGAGSDTMTGNSGDDFYIVDNAGDQVIEDKNGGIDTVLSYITFSLEALPEVENLELLGNGKINGTGNAGANKITGNDTDNILNGGDGNDILDGAGGKDRLLGGAGDDVYFVDNIGDVVVETLSAAQGGGIDTVKSTFSFSLAGLANVDNVTLLGHEAINATGNALNNTLIGNDNDNRLDGAAGADLMSGGMGNDSYFLDNANDVIVEEDNGGYDTAFIKGGAFAPGTSFIDMHDARFAFVEALTLLDKNIQTVIGTDSSNMIVGNALENLFYGGAGSDRMDGGAGNDILVGGDGDDQLTGGKGADLLMGGAGDDVYYIDNARDVVVEAQDNGADSGGFDQVFSSVSVNLLSLGGGRIEDAILLGKAGISLVGNNADNTLDGNAGNNKIAGGDGSDSIYGNDGNDVIDGGNQGDLLVGGKGADILTGGAGSDIFAYYNLNEKGDTIRDFQRGAGGDSIDISYLLDTNTIYNDGAGGQIENYVRILNGNLLQIDVDGNNSGWVTLVKFQGYNDLTLHDLNLVTD